MCALELERLDVMLLALWRRVQNGDERAIDRALKIEERRAKLLGLDAPIRAVTLEDIEREIARLETEITAREQQAP